MKRALALAVLMLAACDQKNDDEISEGAICGSEDIRGVELAPIKGKGICGIPDPVRVSEVSGVRLMPPATLNCKAATALNTYVSTKAIPDIGTLGGGLDHLEVASSYACRTRNNQGGRMSEHAKGNAIDIAAYVLANGQALVVDSDWGKKIMKTLHHDGCGIFGTVLGPESDRFHHNHFHFDVAEYRNGPWCR